MYHMKKGELSFERIVSRSEKYMYCLDTDNTSYFARWKFSEQLRNKRNQEFCYTLNGAVVQTQKECLFIRKEVPFGILLKATMTMTLKMKAIKQIFHIIVLFTAYNLK